MSGIESPRLKFDTETVFSRTFKERYMDNKKQDSKKGNSGREPGRESSEKGNQGGSSDR